MPATHRPVVFRGMELAILNRKIFFIVMLKTRHFRLVWVEGQYVLAGLIKSEISAVDVAAGFYDRLNFACNHSIEFSDAWCVKSCYN